MRCRGDDVRCVADLLLDGGVHGAQVGAGHHDVAEHAARDVEGFQDGFVPILRARVQQAGGGSVGVLVGLGAGKQEAQVVGDHQERLGGGQLFGMLALQGQQLVDGVERLALDARAAVHRVGGHDGVGHGVHAVGALVTVGHGVAQDLVVFIQQDEVDGPGVDAHGLRREAGFLAFGQAGNRFAEQHVHVPAVVAVRSLLDVVEAVDLGKLDGSVFGHLAHDDAAGRCADVDGGVAVGLDFH